MAKNSFIDFKAVKAAITMEQVLGHYGLLDKFKRAGDSLNGACPIHKGSNPTQFRVSVSKNVWNCFSECKHGGNALDFISEMEKVSIHAAALKAIAHDGLSVMIGTPSMYSITRKSLPPSLSKLYRVSILEWFKRARVSASWRKRRRAVSSWVTVSGNSLRATSRCKCSSRARYTTPMPPWPTRSRRR